MIIDGITEARFWAKVSKTTDTNQCWIWTASKDSGGYGRLCAGNKLLGAHRIAWELANGPIPEGLYVLHNCPTGDNPSCVNANHLWLGTQIENISDRVKKGRTCKHSGESNGRAKLSEEDVKAIRNHFASGKRLKEIADLFGISTSTAHFAIIGKTWNLVPGALIYDRNQIKLTPDIVKQIRRLRESGFQYREIAKQFGIGAPTAFKVANRISWKHVD